MEPTGAEGARHARLDPAIDPTVVGLPPDFFERTGLRPGHQIVVRSGRTAVKLGTESCETLDECDMSMSPSLFIYLGMEADGEVMVEERDTLGEEVWEAIEAFSQVLEGSARRIAQLLDLRKGGLERLTGKEVLTRLASERGLDEGGSIIVPPNPEGFGIPREEICEDPSLHVKLWDPSGGAGDVKVFRPGGGEGTDGGGGAPQDDA